jgi:hypothetical protein
MSFMNFSKNWRSMAAKVGSGSFSEVVGLVATVCVGSGVLSPKDRVSGSGSLSLGSI